MRIVRLWVPVCLAGLVVACGQKGPLVLPDTPKHKKTVSSPRTPTAPVPTAPVPTAPAPTTPAPTAPAAAPAPPASESPAPAGTPASGEAKNGPSDAAAKP
ncbi:MAG TPA: lipoprotein [Steroidobacteraceae bacterium]|nr:lipoprotein [Steroidobacteraceae bacterium]